MSVYYLADPRNSQATTLVGGWSQGPRTVHGKAYAPYLVLLMVCAGLVFGLTIGNSVFTACAALVALLGLSVAIKEQKARNKYKRFQKLLATGEIIVVSDEIRDELRVHLRAAEIRWDMRAVLQRSFTEVKALQTFLNEIGSPNRHNDDNQWHRALLLEDRTKRMVNVYRGKQLSPEDEEAARQLASEIVREHELNQFRIGRRLQDELDG